MKKFDRRVAVITGAGGGIGRALALELAGRGARLALVDVNPEALEGTAAAVAPTGVAVSSHLVDVTDPHQMQALAAAVVAEHGQVNLLINNAGITLQKSFATHSLADWERVVGINFWGVLYGCHFFLEALRAANEAHIVNMSSMAGLLGMPSQASYCATKAAVKGLSESLWAELAVDGIGVTSVHPGAIRTEMINATMADSDDPAVAQKNYELAQKIGVDADRAAKVIVEAVRKNKLRVRIGKDAFALDWLKRLFPVGIHRPFRALARRAMPKSP